MFLARRDPNHVAGPDFFDRAAIQLNQPQPAVTIKVWPSGCVCHAVRAPGSNVTLALRTRAGSGASMIGSIRTVPEKYFAGPLPDGREPLRLMSIVAFLTAA